MVTKDSYFRIFVNYVFIVGLSGYFPGIPAYSLSQFQAAGPTLVMASCYVLFYYLKFKNFIGKKLPKMPMPSSNLS